MPIASLSQFPIPTGFLVALVITSNQGAGWPVTVTPQSSAVAPEVGDTLTVTADFASDSAMAVSCDIGFRNAIVIVPGNQPQRDAAVALQYTNRGLYWSGSLGPGAALRLEARFIAASCGADTIVAFAMEAHPPEPTCMATGEAVPSVRAPFYVRSGIPICIRGYRAPPGPPKSEDDRRGGVLMAYPSGSPLPDSLLQRMPPPPPKLPAVATWPPEPSLQDAPSKEHDPCCLHSAEKPGG